MVCVENTYHRGKHHYTAGLQFDWFEFSSLSTYNLYKKNNFLCGQIVSNITGDHLYSGASPMVSVL